MSQAYIVSALRTPIGAMTGPMYSLSNEDIVSRLIRGSLDKSQCQSSDVKGQWMGMSFADGIQAYEAARHSLLLADVPESVPSSVVNAMEVSVLEAMSCSAQQAGENAGLFLAGGVERMSPLNQTQVNKRPHLDIVRNHQDVCAPLLVAAEHVANQSGLSREELDAWVLESHQKASKASDDGKLDDELVALHWEENSWGEKGLTSSQARLQNDEMPRDDLSLEVFKQANPSLTPNSRLCRHHAALPASSAALITMASEQWLNEKGVSPLAQVMSYEVLNGTPLKMMDSLEAVCKKALDASGLKLENIGAFQISEDFTVEPIELIKRMSLDKEKVNIHGGSLAYGLAVSASSGIQVVRLIHELKATKQEVGLVATLAYGGLAAAAVIKLAS